MIIEDIIAACEAFKEKNIDLYPYFIEIRSAYDGIVFVTDNKTEYKYRYETQTIEKLQPWKRVK